MAKDSLNIRAAFLHNIADARTSVAVIVVGALVWAYDWRIFDPALTLGISAYILWHAQRDIRPVIRILMLGAHPAVQTEEVVAEILAIDRVADVHNVYLWQIDEWRFTLQAHLVIERDLADDAVLRRAVKAMLGARFALGHVTLETEPTGGACRDPALIGGG